MKSRSFLFAAATLLALPVSALAGDGGTMTIKGARLYVPKGVATPGGTIGPIEIVGFSSRTREAAKPEEASSDQGKGQGQGRGRGRGGGGGGGYGYGGNRQQNARDGMRVIVFRTADKFTPMFEQAAQTGAQLPTVELRFTHEEDGKATIVRTIVLFGATIERKGGKAKPEMAEGPERLILSYRRMEQRDGTGRLLKPGDWRFPEVGTPKSAVVPEPESKPAAEPPAAEPPAAEPMSPPPGEPASPPAK